MPDAVFYIFAFLIGAVVGSFLNVVIHRVPRGQSVVFPNSACPKCGTAIKPYDNIPILGWLILGGTCRSCKAPISARYPAVEFLTAALFLLTAYQVGLTPFLAVALPLVAALVALMFIDAEHMILPNVITYPLLIFAVAARLLLPACCSPGFFSDMSYWPATALAGQPVWIASLAAGAAGAAVGGGSLWLIGELWKRARGVDAMGLGDVKMMLGVGALLGWKLSFLAIFLAAFSGAVVGVFVIARQKEKNFQSQLPFGIFLGIGSIIALLFGEGLVQWYMNTFVP